MKKLFALFAIAGMLFASSCENKATEEATEVETPEVVEETPEVVEEATEEVVEEATEEAAKN